MLAKLGIVKAHVDYKISSGLASNGVRDWPERFAAGAAAVPARSRDLHGGRERRVDRRQCDRRRRRRPRGRRSTARQVAEMMDLLVGGTAQRTVFWIGSPDARHALRPRREGARPRHAGRGGQAPDGRLHRRVRHVLGERRVLRRTSRTPTATRVQMRISDGVHFTPAGSRVPRRSTCTSCSNSRWNLAGQADPGARRSRTRS